MADKPCLCVLRLQDDLPPISPKPAEWPLGTRDGRALLVFGLDRRREWPHALTARDAASPVIQFLPIDINPPSRIQVQAWRSSGLNPSQETMSAPHPIDLSRLPDHLAGVLKRHECFASKFPGLLLYLSDDGEIRVTPFRPRLPFEYASTADEVLQMGCPRHFDWPEQPWIDCFFVPEFRRLYQPLFDAIEDDGFDEGFASYHAFRLQSLRAAFGGSNLGVSVVTHTETEVVYEISCEAIAGPDLPSSFPPSTGIQAFARFYAYTRSALGQYGPLHIEDGRFVSASFMGRSVTDDAVALITGVSSIGSLCPDLRTITLNNTALTAGCVDALRTVFPQVTII